MRVTVTNKCRSKKMKRKKQRSGGPTLKKKNHTVQQNLTFERRAEAYFEEHGFVSQSFSQRKFDKELEGTTKNPWMCTVYDYFSKEMTSRIRLYLPIDKAALKQSVEWWLTGKGTFPSIHEYGWTDRFNRQRIKLLDAFILARMPPSRVAAFIESQRTGRLCISVKRASNRTIVKRWLFSISSNTQARMVFPKYTEPPEDRL